LNIYIVNHSTVLPDNEIEVCLPAFQTFISHVHAYWPKTATLKFVTPANLPKNVWTIVVADDSDQAGALGYHDFTPGAKPVSYVFAKTDQDYGYSWSVTLTHELAEMMVDPYINDAIQVSNTKFFASEVGDPVEDDSYGYEITTKAGTKVLVSDFVTPAWFIPGHLGPVYDHAKHCTKPLQLLSGGYMSVYVSGHGWSQITAEKGEIIDIGIDAKKDIKGHYSRPEAYARDRGEFKLSELLQ
jgi:hypothetical protein